MIFGIKSPIILKTNLMAGPIYNKKFLRTKKKYCGDKNTVFHDKEMTKVGMIKK